jgi:hypothetical protein
MASIVAARQGAPAIKLKIRAILDDADSVDQEEAERYGKAWR